MYFIHVDCIDVRESTHNLFSATVKIVIFYINIYTHFFQISTDNITKGMCDFFIVSFFFYFFTTYLIEIV
jgi:hypothetical protein